MKKDFLQIAVEKNYPGFRLTAEFTVGEGEFFSLVGPSGCGKTTLLRLIAGLAQPDRGRIILDGRDLTTIPVANREIGFVFQDYALFPHLTVEGNIEYGLKVRRLPASQRRQRLEEMLTLFEIKSLASRRIHELSGGERQRVALARALAPAPALLLLDEPFAALDYGLRRRLRRELKDLQTRLGFTAIFVTHQQEEALSMSERLAVMQAGAVLQIGTAAEVYSNPRHPFVAEFLGDANLLPCVVQADKEGVTVKPVGGGAFTLSRENVPGSGSYLMMLRPEDVIPAMDDPIYTGELVTVEYLGYGSYAEIKLAAGQIVKMLVPKEICLQKGCPLGISFRKPALKLIPINTNPRS